VICGGFYQDFLRGVQHDESAIQVAIQHANQIAVGLCHCSLDIWYCFADHRHPLVVTGQDCDMAGASGRSGRKPKPVERKLVAGNPGKRALNRAAPQFGEVVDIDPPADWKPGPARDRWLHLAPLLCAQGVLQATDIQNLEVYCAAYGRFRQAEQHMAEHGVVIRDKRGRFAKNPAATVANEAARRMATFGALLGLDPSSRQRLIGPKKRDGGNELTAILEM